MTRRTSCSAGSTWAATPSIIAHEHAERVALGLETRRDDVAEVLPVGLKCGGAVALDLDLIQVVDVEDARRGRLAPPSRRPGCDAGELQRAHRSRRDEV